MQISFYEKFERWKWGLTLLILLSTGSFLSGQNAPPPVCLEVEEECYYLADSIKTGVCELHKYPLHYWYGNDRMPVQMVKMTPGDISLVKNWLRGQLEEGRLSGRMLLEAAGYLEKAIPPVLYPGDTVGANLSPEFKKSIAENVFPIIELQEFCLMEIVDTDSLALGLVGEFYVPFVKYRMKIYHPIFEIHLPKKPSLARTFGRKTPFELRCIEFEM